MDKQLLDVIRTIIREDVQAGVRAEIRIALIPMYAHLDNLESRMDTLELGLIHLQSGVEVGFKKIDSKLKGYDAKFREQDHKLDAILEAWEIQKTHRKELNDHENRIQVIEHRIPAIS